MIFARSHGSRVEHLAADRSSPTLCGKDSRLMARFSGSERGQDAKIRPLCEDCRTAAAARRATR